MKRSLLAIKVDVEGLIKDNLVVFQWESATRTKQYTTESSNDGTIQSRVEKDVLRLKDELDGE